MKAFPALLHLLLPLLLLTACEQKPEEVSAATPDPATVAARRAITPPPANKPGSWMWDPNRPGNVLNPATTSHTPSPTLNHR